MSALATGPSRRFDILFNDVAGIRADLLTCELHAKVSKLVQFYCNAGNMRCRYRRAMGCRDEMCNGGART